MIKICNKDVDEGLHMTLDTPATINVECEYVAKWEDNTGYGHSVCCYHDKCDLCEDTSIEEYYKQMKI